MKPSDKKRFVAYLVGCAELYGRDIGEGVLAIWWEALKRHDLEAIEAAFARHLTSPDVGQFMPKPADVIRMLEGTSIDAAQVAWAKVDKAVRVIGPYASVCFDDAIAMRVLLDMGGWIALCEHTDVQWPFVANEFRTRYTGFRSRGEQPEYPPRLVGITEADTLRRGFSAGDVVFVGDGKRARLVAENGTERPLVGFQRVATSVPALAQLP